MPGNDLNLTIPTVLVTEGPDYATQVNTVLEALIDDIEAKVTPDEIQVNQDFDIRNNSLINTATVELTPYVSTLGSSNPGRVYAVGDELYYQDGQGTNVQITASGGVNNASAGSINTTGAPAYGSSGTELLWSGPDLEFRFKSGNGTDDLAGIIVGDVQLGSGANRVTLSTDAAADYPVTLPSVPAANNSLFQISTAGVVEWSRDIDVATVTASGDLVARQIYHSAAEELDVSAIAFENSGWSVGPTPSANYFSDSAAAVANAYYYLHERLIGTSITEIIFHYSTNTASQTWGAAIESEPYTGGVSSSLDSTTWTGLVPGSGTSSFVWTPTAELVTGDRYYYIRIHTPVNPGTKQFWGMSIKFTRDV